jgi:hypothetical protein
MRSTRKTFVNFSARIDLGTNARRERIERFWDATTPQLLEKVFRLAEEKILRDLTADQREAYLSGLEVGTDGDAPSATAR